MRRITEVGFIEKFLGVVPENCEFMAEDLDDFYRFANLKSYNTRGVIFNHVRFRDRLKLEYVDNSHRFAYYKDGESVDMSVADDIITGFLNCGHFCGILRDESFKDGLITFGTRSLKEEYNLKLGEHMILTDPVVSLVEYMGMGLSFVSEYRLLEEFLKGV